MKNNNPLRRLRLPILLLLLLVLLFLSTTASAVKQPTSYCKCICFQNSTIIPLNSPPQQPPSSPPSAALLSHRSPADDDTDADTDTNAENSTAGKKHHTLTCNDCNRAFCLEYNLPICKNAKEEDVFATCFQRDSLKDRTIVILFLLATSSLLGWALIKPFVVKTTDSIRTSSENMGLGRYMPVRHAITPSEDLGLGHNHTRAGGAMFDASSGGGGGGEGGRRSRTGGGSLSRQGGLNS